MTDDVELHAESFTVHAREKISTGDYENAEYHTTIEGRVETDDPITNGTRRALKARLLAMQKDAQETVERAAENRVALPESEDWSVREADE